jgi:hypothetical protein
MKVALVIRTVVNESAGYSPFFLNTRRRYLSFGGDYALKQKSNNTTVNAVCNHHATTLHNSYGNVLLDLQRRLKKAYDQNSGAKKAVVSS